MPGTAGSRLSLFVDGKKDKELWPHWDPGSDESAKKSWEPLSLHESGAEGPPGHPEWQVGATDVFEAWPFKFLCRTWFDKPCVYKLWLAHMKSTEAGGYVENQSLFLFPYDWRLDINLHALILDRLVDRALGMDYNRKAANWKPTDRPEYQRAARDKVVIIAHSQGGLVARAHLADQNRAKKVEYLIQLAPTNYGSEKASKPWAIPDTASRRPSWAPRWANGWRGTTRPRTSSSRL